MNIPSFKAVKLTNPIGKISPLVKIETKKKASYFIMTFTFISLSLFGVFAIRPTLITATSLVKSVSDLKQLNDDYENKISALIRAQSEYEQIRDDISVINEALPNNALFNNLAKTIEKYALSDNIAITQLQIDTVPISTPSPDGKLNQYIFSMIGVGTYPSVNSFIMRLSNWRRIVAINSLELTPDGSTTSSDIRMVLKGTTFYEP